MRAYRIERSTMEWVHILRLIESGNKPIYIKESETGVTLLDEFVADLMQMIEHDSNHVHNKGTELPERMSNSNDPVMSWREHRQMMDEEN